MSWWSEPLLPEYNPYSPRQIRFVLLSVLAVGVVFVISAFRFSATLDPVEAAVIDEEVQYLRANGRSSLDNLRAGCAGDDLMKAKRDIVTFMVVSKERVKHPDEKLLCLATTEVYWVPPSYSDHCVKEMDNLREENNLQDWIPGKPETAGYDLKGNKTKYWKDRVQRHEYRKVIEAKREEDWKDQKAYFAKLVAAAKENANGR